MTLPIFDYLCPIGKCTKNLKLLDKIKNSQKELMSVETISSNNYESQILKHILLSEEERILLSTISKPTVSFDENQLREIKTQKEVEFGMVEKQALVNLLMKEHRNERDQAIIGIVEKKFSIKEKE
eukprot:CAMPEP_0170520950 /NCGR_PEP_ID=MMETSP0209-20121228/6280_1 /TAXON_ID=665100 ORGANISM="Litonotus pictus, Strain P1" /NCGR_SAMPLE_ID=MMETSP0209 /ASSEMBLY_ACC=CAM_ASM_000301 /LENGTH=125 /DNA_ID=CAMNT_0010807553 /DNA_START=1276 /DNA_END=1653 /DNA_ORIENTATION=+